MEGPSLVILKEELRQFKGKPILKVSGNSREPITELKGKILSGVKTWGKVLFLIFSDPHKRELLYTKTHFMMFGSYRIDDPRENRIPRLKLSFAQGTLYFYACSFKFIDRATYLARDWEVDVMSPQFNPDHVMELLETKKDSYLCDLFLDQNLFSGSGNIIKNEVLYNFRLHPLTKLKDLKKRDWKKLITGIKNYSFDFYQWKKKFELRQHWQVYKNRICKLCDHQLVHQNMGRLHRPEFYCPHCQNKKNSLEKITLHPVLPLKEKKKSEKRIDH